MKRKRLSHIRKYLLFILLIGLASGCATGPYPTYYSYTDENGYNTIVEIDGIVYKQAPGNWGIDIEQRGGKLGYLDDTSKIIYEIQGDSSRNYLYAQVGKGYLAYFEKDFIFPEVSVDSVNMIHWWDSNKTRDITDHETIQLFFSEVSNGTSISEHGNWWVFGQLYCYIEQFPGVYYTYQIITYNGMYACSDFSQDNYVDISKDLVEKLAGYEIN